MDNHMEFSDIASAFLRALRERSAQRAAVGTAGPGATHAVWQVLMKVS